MHVTAADLHDEQAVQALQGHRAVHVEEIGGEHRRSLRMQELPPGRVGASLRCGRDLERLEDPADGGRTDPVAEFDQFALDPLVSPAVVLGGEPLDQGGDLGADRWPSRLVGVGPPAGWCVQNEPFWCMYGGVTRVTAYRPPATCPDLRRRC
jgi:hypothetical protein